MRDEYAFSDTIRRVTRCETGAMMSYKSYPLSRARTFIQLEMIMRYYSVLMRSSTRMTIVTNVENVSVIPGVTSIAKTLTEILISIVCSR